MQIKMVDLAGQLQKIKPEIDEAIQGVLAHTQFINGPEVKTFEHSLAEYLNVKHVIGCANGTDALQIALMALDLQPGDEIITPSYTYAATVEVVALLGLKQVFVEVDENTFNIDVETLRLAINDKTKAIIPVHLYGQCANMEAVMKIAEEHSLFVVEDTAQAIGAEYILADGSRKKAGTIGHIGTTSFFPSKNLGCYGDGGAVFTNDDSLAAKIRAIANHGQTKQYVHDLVGVNSRLDSLQAAILNVKLKYLDEYNAARNRVADYYDAAFLDIENIKVPFRAKWSTHVFHQYTLTLKNVDRDAVRSTLASIGIPTMIYYPVPNHLQEAYKDSGRVVADLKITEKLCESVLSLPIHTEMNAEQFDFISKNVIDTVKSMTIN